MRSQNQGEPARFFIEEGTIKTFLSERGFKLIEHYKPCDLENNFLYTSDGSFLGNITALFRIVRASVIY